MCSSNPSSTVLFNNCNYEENFGYELCLCRCCFTGVLDPATRDWTDGLLSNIFREINKPTDKNERKYIVFDGDVDALWVENMNSVMDDNRLLTLANGERIRLQKHCALLFEVKPHFNQRSLMRALIDNS